MKSKFRKCLACLSTATVLSIGSCLSTATDVLPPDLQASIQDAVQDVLDDFEAHVCDDTAS